jgi:hypothetical protein
MAEDTLLNRKKSGNNGFLISENGMLKGDGIPDGVTIDMNAYKQAASKYAGSSTERDASGLNSMYPSMGGENPLQGKAKPTLSDSVTKFRYGKDGELLAFIPEMTTSGPSMADLNGGVSTPKVDPRGMANANIQLPRKEYGEWVKASGFTLDKSSASGNTDRRDFTIRMDQGSPLAVFGDDDGYMRLAMQQAKAADNILLGNNTGTTTQQRRRTIL